MDCQYCHNKFSTKPNLLYHQKTARYCLKLRGEKETDKFKCNFCKKEYTSNFRLTTHVQKCIKTSGELINLRETAKILSYKVEEQTQTIQEQKYTIQDLQNKLENIAISAVNRPTTTKNTHINNYIQRLQPITDEDMVDNVPNLTIDHIIKGAEGYVQYALEYPLKDKIVCSDYSRRKVKFKDKDGNVITDPEMTCLATKFFTSIKDRNKELIMKYGNELKDKFGDEMGTIVSILDYKMAVDKGSEGEKTEFHHEFVKQLCSKTIME